MDQIRRLITFSTSTLAINVDGFNQPSPNTLNSAINRFQPHHHQVSSVLKSIAVFVNKTLLEILLVGLNIYLTIGEHKIAYTDLKKYIEK